MSFPNKETILVIDGDILLYSIGFGSETIQEEWIVESRIEHFFSKLFEKFNTFNYKVYLTGDNNFRKDTAVTHKYKGNRKAEKPRWYGHIRDYLIHMYNTEVCEDIEADDGMAMHITRNPNSILCSIDKDLWMVEGWHYSWPMHNRGELPLRWITNEGFLELQQLAKKKKLIGGGLPWFYAQLLMGDKTDNIVGPKGYGDVKTWNTLKDAETESELYACVKEVYEASFEQPEQRLRENADLLWMIKELNEDGSYKMWEIPND
ncbi:MAG: putative ribonuclease H [Prokaryotic dsDNA virus sp.]|nr:MAG: putative ribonuclease H [Prokaryotic dsDNA virus sp.]|tara:strand:+ start:1277 stop:2062 length:786 start_codon:yes stop_codon:yes gene_type:complete